MEALAISAANLNIIENNLGEVAKELNGVVSNVNYMNNHVSEVESKVQSLNNEIQNMMQEIRENTIITNARQTIMYNNQEIEKKFGYYDNVRRVTLSIIDAIKFSSIQTDTLKKLREDILLNNPNYWLTNALAALTSWFLDDKENTYKELNNALRLDEEKTSIFFMIVNLKLDRIQTSINWLNKYLSIQDPTNLNKDFVNILDLVSSGLFGDEQKHIVLKKINEWQLNLNSNKKIIDKQEDTWRNYIIDHSRYTLNFKYLKNFSKESEILENNIAITNAYENILNTFEAINTTPNSNKKINEIFKNLIYEYEEQEQIYQEDNLRNKLLIECNGDKQEAARLYEKQKDIYSNKLDIISLLTNIAIYPNSYKISNETQKIALSLVKEHILKALEETTEFTKNQNIEIKVDDFTTNTTDATNYNEVIKELETFLENKYKVDEKNVLLVLIIINTLGLIGVFLTFEKAAFIIIIAIAMLIANIILLTKIKNEQTASKNEKKRIKENISSSITKAFAEITDYNNALIKNKNNYQRLQTYLSNLNTIDYINNNDERNIII